MALSEIVSYTLDERQGSSAPIEYTIYNNLGRGASARADVDESEIQFDSGGSTGYSSDIGSWYSDNQVNNEICIR